MGFDPESLGMIDWVISCLEVKELPSLHIYFFVWLRYFLLIAYHVYPVMVNRIRTIYPPGLDKGFSSRFCVGSQVQYETPEEGQRIYQLKH